jgi:hypothetical protein
MIITNDWDLEWSLRRNEERKKKKKKKELSVLFTPTYHRSSRFTSCLCKSRLDSLYLFNQDTNSLHKQILWWNGTRRLDIDYN